MASIHKSVRLLYVFKPIEQIISCDFYNTSFDFIGIYLNLLLKVHMLMLYTTNY